MKEKSPLSVKLETGLSERLDECSRRTKIKKYSLALMAIEAAVEAIEKNDYRLVVPIQFEVSDVPNAVRTDEVTTRAELNEANYLIPAGRKIGKILSGKAGKPSSAGSK